MGPVIVLTLWAIVASIGSLVGGLALAGIVAILTRKLPDTQRKRFIRVGRYLPAACAAYLFGCVIVISIWSAFRGKDMGWGDEWQTPILGGYGLDMTDVTDSATVYETVDPGKDGTAAASRRIDVIAGVKRLEVRPPYLLGAANPRDFGDHQENSVETDFFILDTRNTSRTNEPSLAALEAAALKLGKPLHLEPVSVIYDRDRWDSIDLILILFLALPPLIVFFLLARALWIARQSALRNQLAL